MVQNNSAERTVNDVRHPAGFYFYPPFPVVDLVKEASSFGIG